MASSLAGLVKHAPLDPAGLAAIVAGRAPAFDRAGEQHYNLMSALHKTLRGSDADAALYWLARLSLPSVPGSAALDGQRDFAFGYELQATSYELRAASYELQATSYKLQATSYELRAASYELQTSSYELQAASYELRATSAAASSARRHPSPASLAGRPPANRHPCNPRARPTGDPRRTFTVRARDVADPALLEGLDIDVGAYRFAFEQHLPADLIRGPLKLPTQ